MIWRWHTCTWRLWASAGCRRFSLRLLFASWWRYRRFSWSLSVPDPSVWKQSRNTASCDSQSSSSCRVCSVMFSGGGTWSWAEAAIRAAARRREWSLRPDRRRAERPSRPACHGSHSRADSGWPSGWSARIRHRTDLRTQHGVLCSARVNWSYYEWFISKRWSVCLLLSPLSPHRLKYSLVSSSIIWTCPLKCAMFSPVFSIFFCSRNNWTNTNHIMMRGCQRLTSGGWFKNFKIFYVVVPTNI